MSKGEGAVEDADLLVVERQILAVLNTQNKTCNDLQCYQSITYLLRLVGSAKGDQSGPADQNEDFGVLVDPTEGFRVDWLNFLVEHGEEQREQNHEGDEEEGEAHERQVDRPEALERRVHRVRGAAAEEDLDEALEERLVGDPEQEGDHVARVLGQHFGRVVSFFVEVNDMKHSVGQSQHEQRSEPIQSPEQVLGLSLSDERHDARNRTDHRHKINQIVISPLEVLLC